MNFIEQPEANLIHLNMPPTFKEPQFPFGGIKQSGSGLPEAGKTGIGFITQHKTVYMKCGTI